MIKDMTPVSQTFIDFLRSNNIPSVEYKGITVGVIEGVGVPKIDNPHKFKLYSLRHSSEDWSKPITIEPIVIADRWGWLFCDRDIFKYLGVNNAIDASNPYVNLSKRYSDKFMVSQWEEHC